MEYFNLKANNTSIKQEILAGITTFATMSYILVVNPQILGAAGMDKDGVFVHNLCALATVACPTSWIQGRTHQITYE